MEEETFVPMKQVRRRNGGSCSRENLSKWCLPKQRCTWNLGPKKGACRWGCLWRRTLNLMGQDLGKIEVFLPGGVRTLARKSRTSAATWGLPRGSCCVWRNVLKILSLPNLEQHEDFFFENVFECNVWRLGSINTVPYFIVVDGSVSVSHTERIPWSYTGIRIPKESQNVYENC